MSDLEKIRARNREAQRRYREKHGNLYQQIYANKTDYYAQKEYYQRNKEAIKQKQRERYAKKKEEEAAKKKENKEADE